MTVTETIFTKLHQVTEMQ